MIPLKAWMKESRPPLLWPNIHADLLLIDERAGFRAAKKRGLCVTGTLGVLDLAAKRGLIDFCRSNPSVGEHELLASNKSARNTSRQT